MGIVHGGVRCVFASGAGDRIYDKVSCLEAGATIGVQSHSMIRVINSDDALAKFTTRERESGLGVDGSAAITQPSASSDLLAGKVGSGLDPCGPRERKGEGFSADGKPSE